VPPHLQSFIALPWEVQKSNFSPMFSNDFDQMANVSILSIVFIILELWTQMALF